MMCTYCKQNNVLPHEIGTSPLILFVTVCRKNCIMEADRPPRGLMHDCGRTKEQDRAYLSSQSTSIVASSTTVVERRSKEGHNLSLDIA